MKNDDKKLYEELSKNFDDLFGDFDSDNSDASDFLPEEEEVNGATIILNDEDGNEIPFNLLDYIEYKGEEYVVLLPQDDDGEVVILKVDESENENEEAFSSVDNADVLNAVFNIFKEKFRDEFDFLD